MEIAQPREFDELGARETAWSSLVPWLKSAPGRPESPIVTTPRQALGEGVDLIIVASGECQQFCDEGLEPRSFPWKLD
jgi:hypothetical protein